MTIVIKLHATTNETKLEKAVRTIINEGATDYEEGVAGYMEDLTQGGCQSGMVSELIYYADTVAFYKKHKDDINTLLYNLLSDTGYKNPEDLFGDKWEKDDPLALEDMNRNLLAWFAFEETARILADRAGVEI